MVGTAGDDGALRDVDEIAADVWAARGAAPPVTFDRRPEQLEAKRLLAAALAEGPAHAYLLHGPPGVGKGDLALLFAAELLGDHARVGRRTHPDLYVLEPLGDQIRIDDIRDAARDLHMRPFEASRRVYLVFGADTMNEDAADALLKDLEEPPPYAVIVLIANDIGPLPETIRSRCQRGAVPAALGARRARGDPHAGAGASRGRGDDARARRRRPARPCRAIARSCRREPARGAARGRALRLPRPRVRRRRRADSAARGHRRARRRGEGARRRSRSTVLELTGREAEQRVRRAQRGAERDELLAVLEELEWWYRDLVVLAAGAEAAVVHVDRLEELRADATLERLLGAEAACEAVRAAWRRPRSSSSRRRSRSRRCSSGSGGSSPACGLARARTRKFSGPRPSCETGNRGGR